RELDIRDIAENGIILYGDDSTGYSNNLNIYNSSFSNISTNLPNGWLKANQGAIRMHRIDGSEIKNVVINNISTNQGGGIKFYLPNNPSVKNIKIHDCTIVSQWLDIELWSMSDGCEIYNNKFFGWLSLLGYGKGSKSYGLYVHDNTFSYSSNQWQKYCIELSMDDAIIEKNYFENYPERAVVMWNNTGHDNIRINNNIFYNIKMDSILAGVPSGGMNILNIYNNLFHCNNGSVAPAIRIDFVSGSTLSNVNIKNNIFIGDNSGSGIINRTGTGTLTNSVFTNNLSYQINNTNLTDFTQSNNLLNTNPQILATGSRRDTYYQLNSNSPCIETGVNVGLPYNGNAPDIGRWEYSGSTPDTTAPATINTLTTNSPTTNSITLNWTSVGDDGTTGTAGSYDIRYYTSQINDSNWSSAIPCTGETLPIATGNNETYTVNGLTPDTTYYFAMKVGDEVPNLSGISNSPSGKTQSASAAIAEWKLDEGSGTTASDTSGNNNNGTLNGSPAWVAGKVNTGLEFDGTNKYVSVNDSNSLDITTTLSIEAWVKSDVITTDGGPTRRIIDKGVYALGASNQAYFRVVIGGTGIGVANTWSNSDIGLWRYIAGTYDAAGGTNNLKLYQDGILVAQATYTGNIDTNTSALNIGRQGSTTGRFDGIIDEVKIYSRVLTANEILQHYNAGNITPADTTAPATINTLTTNSPTTNSLTLNWTSVGDDGTTGTAGSYDIRYATYSINTVNWDTVTQCTNEPNPQASGNSETFAVTGLISDTTYYFGIKAGDEVPNWSNVSNSPNGKTNPSVGAVFNVKDYGAIGNGATNDAASIQNAINACPSGGEIYFPNGTYLLNSTLTLPPQINIRGESKAGVILKLNHTGDVISALSSSKTNGNQSISSFTVNGNNMGNEIVFRGRDNVTVHNVHIYDLEANRAAIFIYSADGYNGSTPPSFWVSNIKVYNCEFEHNYNGSIGLVGIDGSEVYNIISNERNPSDQVGECITAYGGGWIKNLKVHHCDFTSYYGDVEIWNMFNDNEFYNNTFHGWVSLVAGDKGSGSYSAYLHDNVFSFTSGNWQEYAIEAGMSDMIISKNYICNYPTFGIGMWDPNQRDITINSNIFYNNMILQQYGGDILVGPNGTVSNIRILNNVFHQKNNNAAIYVNPGSVATLSGYYVENNIFMGDNSGASMHYINNTLTKTNWQWNNNCQYQINTGNLAGFTLSNNISANPTILATGNRWDTYYQLASNSPCIDKGVHIPGITDGYIGDAPDIGRWEYVTPDITAPSSINNLTTSNPTATSIVLNWTSVGDDGTIGTATSYDIRYQTYTINAGNWDTVTQFIGEHSPKASNNNESLTITGLISDTTYYFAIKTGDEVPNWSNVSNTASGKTQIVVLQDTTPPSTVNNLSATNPTMNSITLNWTAVGDDGTTGTASIYDIRYTTSTQLTGNNWNGALQCIGEPSPNANGTNEMYTVNGLLANTTYYFGIKVGDEILNWNSISNIVTVKTSGIPSGTPPIGEWHFEEGNGSTAVDTSGNNNTATLYNNIQWVAGRVDNYALQFDGLNTYANINSNNSLDVTTGISLEAWVKTDEITTDGGPTRRVIEKGVYTLAASNQAYFKVQIGGQSKGVGYSWTSSDTDTWHHLVGTYDASGGTDNLKLYQDGVEVAQTTVIGNIDTNTTNLTIGRQSSTAGRFIGAIDEIRIYNRALTSNEVSQHFQGSIIGADIIPPNAINNLTTNSPTTTSVILQWTAVGDDGNIGTAMSYDIRYQTYTITSANWNNATQCIGEPTPKTSGNNETYTVTGLASDTTYYFSIKVVDDNENWSIVS
ncbi:MAG: hypothetical protein A2551_05635, partial [Elusimicrobia bacterium RIFOXYD2_FULL_34_30]